MSLDNFTAGGDVTASRVDSNLHAFMHTHVYVNFSRNLHDLHDSQCSMIVKHGHES
jgi:hypothetical protein